MRKGVKNPQQRLLSSISRPEAGKSARYEVVNNNLYRAVSKHLPWEQRDLEVMTSASSPSEPSTGRYQRLVLDVGEKRQKSNAVLIMHMKALIRARSETVGQ